MKLFPVVLVSFLVFSCQWQQNNPKAVDTVVPAAKDTIHLVDTLRSYEPNIYKGTVPKAFYTHRGMYDWWRFPLVYPYAILCIDVTEYGSICSDRGTTDYDAGGSSVSLTPYFDKFTFDRSYFVGSKFNRFSNDRTTDFEQYFIFSFSKASIREISGKDSLYKRLKELKFSGDTSFMTIREFAEKL